MTLSVAVSLKDVTEELGRTFMAAHPGVTLRCNFGASGDLQKQIDAGARIDVFLSAAPRQIVVASRRAFARNLLTVIKPSDSKVDIARAADLLEARVGCVAIGNPAASRQSALGHAFLDLLGGPQGRAVLGRFGFQPPPTPSMGKQ